MQNSQFENLIVLDIETIPDTSCAYQLCNLDNKIEYSEQELRQKIEEYHLNITDGKNTFPRQLFHKVVCISFLEAKIEQLDNGKNFLHFGKLQTYSCMQKSTEEEMIQKFWDYLKSKKPQIVTFNGRTFDIPVLKYRAMKYKIDCGWFFDFGGKWDGYGSKYAKAHMDMIDFLSDYGASARVKMSEACSLLNIPCKLEDESSEKTDGSKVTSMYDSNKFDEIKDYCETDVLATYLIYLRFSILNGTLSVTNFNQAFTDIESFLLKSDKKIYRKFLELMTKPGK